MSDRESQIRSDFTTGQVVWRMAPEVAAFYSEELRRIQGDDFGIKDDAASLMDCATELDDDERLLGA